MQITILLICVYILSPVLIIYITGKNKIANRIGAIIIAYIFGLILGNAGLIPSASENMFQLMQSQPSLKIKELLDLQAQGVLSSNDIYFFKIRKLQDIFTTITIPLAIPLLLFSLNIRDWFRMAGKTMLSLILGLISVITVVSIGFLVFNTKIYDLWKISGMLIGLYTGGTPNLASLKMMLNVDANTYILTHTYDTVIGVFYLFFLIAAGKRVLGKFLLPYPRKNMDIKNNHVSFTENAYKGIFKKKYFIPLLGALGISTLIFGAGGVLSLFVSQNSVMAVVILTITTLSILFSLVPKINRIEKTFELGIYFILVFSVVVASMADVSRLANISLHLFSYITFAVFGSLVLHILLSKLFKVDGDTVMVTSTALICSPPFVPVVAGALGNKEVVVSGLTVGIIGYAIGNYVGLILAYFLQSLG
ncbi:MAG: DUF819 family protein [Bacteroidales bacterium]|nr:DUF819 family protein [Bacteroidales bacterium]